MSFSEKLYFNNFSRLFHCSIIKVHSEFFNSILTLFKPRQRILCYQRYFVLSTLFLYFFEKKTNKNYDTISWCFAFEISQDLSLVNISKYNGEGLGNAPILGYPNIADCRQSGVRTQVLTPFFSCLV